MQLKRLLKSALVLACSGSFAWMSAQQNVNVQPGTSIMVPPQRTCGTPVPSQQWEDDFQRQIADFVMKQNLASNAKGINNTEAVYTIPVIIHVIHGGQAVGTFPNLAQGQLNSQVQVLNDDFAGVGQNVGNYPANAFTTWATNTIVSAASKDGLGRIKISNTGITFCLALKDSLGNTLTEPGIHRVDYNTLPALTGTFTSKNPAAAVYNNPSKFQAFIDGYIKPNTTWNCSKYMNLWVTDEQAAVGLLGYATFPPSSTLVGIPGGIGTRTTDGFWAYAAAFGSKNLFPGGTYSTGYDLGRTCTHEIGHWVGLRHIWGDGTCLTDYCNDTPPASGPNYNNCPVAYPLNAGTCAGPPSNSPDGNMFMNFMDYTYDCAMFMFTEDQRTRIQTAMANSPYRKFLGTHGLCSVPPPVANFSINPSTLCTGQTATVTDMSTGSPGAWSYTMTGGAPATSTLQSPTVSYASAGTYTITLIASNGGGNSAPISQTITVNAVPVLTVTPSPATICAGSSATITSGGATSYTLNPGGITGTTAVVSPTTTTTYTVTGANGSCTSTKTVQVVVSGSIAINITPATSSVCAGNAVTLTGSGATTYTWSTGPNTTTISVTPTATAVYTLTGSTGSCNGSKTATVTVNPLPTVTITANPASICPGNTGTLTATATGPGPWTYTWTGGATTTAITTSVPAVYSATVTNANGCKGIQSYTLNAAPVPTVSAIASPTAICAGSPATLTASGASTYTWNPGGAGSSIAVTPTVTTAYTVTGTNAAGCTGTKTISLVVNPLPVLSINPPTSTVCAGNSTNLTGSGASTYTWSTGANTSSISVTPSITSVYTLTGSSAAGCVGSKTTTVTVNPLPTVTITGNPVSICPGGSSTLTASASGPGPWTYTWNGGATTAAITTSVPAVYSATVTNGNGCKGTMSYTLGTSPSLSLTASATSTAVCAGNSSSLSVTGATSYTWSTGATTSVTAVTPTANTTYTVTGSSGACTGTTSIMVNVNSNPNLIVTAGSPSVCAGNTVALGASGASTYTWNPGGMNGSAIVVNPASSTVYTVTGTNGSGCTGSATQAIAVIGNPTVTAVTSTSLLCVGQTVTLTASGAGTYSWSTGATGASTADSPTVTTTYTVTGNSGTCAGMATVTQSVSLCTNVQQLEAATYAFGIFPNPNNGEFTVTLGSLTDNTYLDICNNLGQVITHYKLTSLSTKITMLWEADGVYHLRINQDGQLMYKTKLLKSK